MRSSDKSSDLLVDSAEELYEQAHVGYLSTQLDGTILRANATLAAWLGYRVEELVGRKRLHDLLAPGARIYYETHYAPLLQMQGEIHEIAAELVRADDSRLPVLLTSTLVRDEAGVPQLVRTTAFDATERRRYERELLRARAEAESRARATLALAHVNDGIVLVDPNGCIEVMNPAAERIFAVNAPAVVGLRAAEAIEGWEVVAATIPIGRTASEQAAEVVATLRSGREQWLEVAAVDAGDGVVYTIRDVTADRRLEQLRSEVVATVSHELRTPLTAAFGSAQTLFVRYDHLDEATRRGLVQMLAEQTRRLTVIVDQILLVSMLDTDNDATSFAVFDASDAFDTLLVSIADEGRRRVVVDAAAGIHIRGDLDRLRQALANLVDNALKYTEGTVRLTVEQREFSARFCIADNGPGIPDAEQDRVFEKFYRLDPNQHSGVGGTGLGLYISRALVERMGGRIGVLPRAGGATFYVDLPLA